MPRYDGWGLIQPFHRHLQIGKANCLSAENITGRSEQLMLKPSPTAAAMGLFCYVAELLDPGSGGSLTNFWPNLASASLSRDESKSVSVLRSQASGLFLVKERLSPFP